MEFIICLLKDFENQLTNIDNIYWTCTMRQLPSLPKEQLYFYLYYFQTMVLERTLGSPLDSKEIKPVNPKGTQPWTFIGRTDAEAEAPIFWPPDAKNWITGKDSDAGKDWRQKEKGGATDDEMVGWHHWLNRHEFEQALGDGEGQGSLACCSPLGHRAGHNLATDSNNNPQYTYFEEIITQLSTIYELLT